MKTTFADVEPNPAIVCVVGPAAVVTFPFNSRQAAVGGAVLAPGGGFLARAPCPSYNPNPNTSIVFLIGVSLAWYLVQCDLADRVRLFVYSGVFQTIYLMYPAYYTPSLYFLFDTDFLKTSSVLRTYTRRKRVLYI